MKKPFSPQRIQFVQSKERISRRVGLLIVNELMNAVKLPEYIDRLFGKPGSNRGFNASNYIAILISMIQDGSIHLEDINHLAADEGFQELFKQYRIPGADAIGDWLRRMGELGGEDKIISTIEYLLASAAGDIPGSTLDIDATVIETGKADATKSYNGKRGFQPLLGIIAENGLVVGSEFRPGYASPQAGLLPFIERCEQTYGKEITIIRSDSAGYQREIIESLMAKGKQFSITADRNSKITRTIDDIPNDQWQQGYDEYGHKTNYEVAETTYTMSAKKRSFRLVAKRTPLKNPTLFSSYQYWIIATNLPMDEYPTNNVILFHQQRGGMERAIGEIKHHLGLKNLPCGQFNANALFFAIGILAYNLLLIVKYLALPPEDRSRSLRSLRYQLLHLAGKITFHARYMVIAVAAPLVNIRKLADCFLRFRYGPLPA